MKIEANRDTDPDRVLASSSDIYEDMAEAVEKYYDDSKIPRFTIPHEIDSMDNWTAYNNLEKALKKMKDYRSKFKVLMISAHGGKYTDGEKNGKSYCILSKGDAIGIGE